MFVTENSLTTKWHDGRLVWTSTDDFVLAYIFPAGHLEFLSTPHLMFNICCCHMKLQSVCNPYSNEAGPLCKAKDKLFNIPTDKLQTFTYF